MPYVQHTLALRRNVLVPTRLRFFSSIANLKARRWRSWDPKIRALFEGTYFAGLLKAGMPEEPGHR